MGQGLEFMHAIDDGFADLNHRMRIGRFFGDISNEIKPPSLAIFDNDMQAGHK